MLKMSEQVSDRRGPIRESLDGNAEIVRPRSGQRDRGVTVDLGEGGFSVLCKLEPELGELLRIDFAGLVVEGYVRYVEREGSSFRIGVEADS